MPTKSISTNNVSSQLKRSLPAESLNLLKGIGDFAQKQSLPIFMVGGPLRDLLLGLPLKDIDLTVEGDAVSFASGLVRQFKGELVAISLFGTAKIKVSGSVIDLATARTETYSQPGALPTVSPRTLEDDLVRRDFSINAMAASLLPADWGRLLDPLGGRKDLAKRRIRVLHPRSFQDDATRILRAIRYEQRLGFHLERNTKALLVSSLKYLDTIGGDRIRHELEHIFNEANAFRMLDRARKLGVLRAISLGLERSPSLGSLARNRKLANEKGNLVYLALLAYPLSGKVTESLIKRLNMPSHWAKVAKDSAKMKGLSSRLARHGQQPSHIYELLHGIVPEALYACETLTRSPLARQRIRLYLDKLRYVKTSLDGDKLLDMGVQQGPIVGKLLDNLRTARLNGEVSTRQQEEQLVQRLLKKYSRS